MTVTMSIKRVKLPKYKGTSAACSNQVGSELSLQEHASYLNLRYG
jgi:hypothetical protein